MAGKLKAKPAAKAPAMSAGAKAGVAAMAKMMNAKVTSHSSGKSGSSKGK